MGVRVEIVRPRFFRKGTAIMRLQVIRRRGWRTISAVRVPELDAGERQARQWMLDYDEYPAGHFRRYP
jgi:hypothetical protein